MRLRQLNNEGLARMEGFLRSLTTERPEPYPESILIEDETSQALAANIGVERREFRRRLDVAEYLYGRIKGLQLPERNKGLWAWLALYWFEQLCPSEKGGNRKPGDLTRWIPKLDSSLRYYRHLLLGPYLVFKAHENDPSRALCVLCQPIHSPGDLVEQIVSRPQLISCAGVMSATSQLYCIGNDTLKRGAGGKGLGSPRRLADILMQFDLTYDLHTLDPNGLLTMLPREFDKFKVERAGTN